MIAVIPCLVGKAAPVEHFVRISNTLSPGNILGHSVKHVSSIVGILVQILIMLPVSVINIGLIRTISRRMCYKYDIGFIGVP